MAYSQAQAPGPSACLKYGALLLFSYALLLITLGFRLYEDAAIPPWAAFLRDPENFTGDLLAQSFQEVSFSERTVAAHGYALLVGRWWLVLLLHAVCGLMLMAGLYEMATHLIKSSDFAWVAVWLCLPGLYYQNWGSNELYYPYVHPSLLAKSVGVWVWVGLLRRWVNLAAGALLIAAAFHPSVGWQLALFSAPLVLSLARRQIVFYGMALSLVLAQTFLLGQLAWPPQESKALWETVFLEFRMGMHFSPTYFKPRSHFLFAVLLVWALWLSIRQKHILRWVFILYALGLSVYVLNYYTFRWAPIWYSQLPRATIWLKPLAFFFLMGYIRERSGIRVHLSASMAILLAGLSLLVVYRLARNEIVGSRYLQVLRWAESPAYRLGECARAILPKTALIAASPSYEAQSAQFFTMRSAFLRLDAHFRTSDVEMYRSRIRLLYGVDPADGYSAWQDLVRTGNAFFDSIAVHHPTLWRAAGITHIITETPGLSPGYPCLCRADPLSLWALPTAADHKGPAHSPIALHPRAEPEKPPLPDETAPLKKLWLAAQKQAHDKAPEAPRAAPDPFPGRP